MKRRIIVTAVLAALAMAVANGDTTDGLLPFDDAVQAGMADQRMTGNYTIVDAEMMGKGCRTPEPAGWHELPAQDGLCNNCHSGRSIGRPAATPRKPRRERSRYRRGEHLYRLPHLLRRSEKVRASLTGGRGR